MLLAKTEYSKLSQEKGTETPFPLTKIKYETVKSESGQVVAKSCMNIKKEQSNIDGDFF